MLAVVKLLLLDGDLVWLIEKTRESKAAQNRKWLIRSYVCHMIKGIQISL